MPPQQESNFHWTGQNVIIFGTPLTDCDMRTGLHSIAWDTFQTQLFSPPLQRCRHDAIPGKWIDWLWLCLGLTVSSDKRTVWSTWIGLCFWFFFSFLNFVETFLARKFCPATFCHRRYHRSECWARDWKEGWQLCQCHQYNCRCWCGPFRSRKQASELDGDNGNASFVFVPCV